MLSLLTRLPWIFAVLTLASPAAGTMVKCRGDKGGVVYQDAPCRPGYELRNFDLDPATVSVVPFAPEHAPAATTPARATTPRQRNAQTAQRPTNRAPSPAKAAERRFIRTGMSESEVLHRIGKPEVDASTSRSNKRKDNKRWSYLPAEGDPQTLTTVTIAGGQVVDVERKIVR
jgi:hypothetical protein